jgi:hypothetical protein
MTDTKIIETPVGKHKVELKLWLTGADKRALRSVYTDEMEISVKGETPEIKNVLGSMINKAEDKAIETVVVSVNGTKENIIKTLLEMRSEDYDFVMDAINELTSTAKKK